MKGILLLSHGTLAMGVLEALAMIGLDTEGVKAIPLYLDSDLDAYGESIRQAVDRLDTGEGVLVAVDIMSGTPFNQICMMLEEKNAEVITGLNLAMVISAMEGRDSKTLDELAKASIEDAKNSILNVRDCL